MMQRREFLRRCALIAAGVVAADQLDVLEMLAPRRLFAGADLIAQPYGVSGLTHMTTLADLWPKVQHNTLLALKDVTPEYDWALSMGVSKRELAHLGIRAS